MPTRTKWWHVSDEQIETLVKGMQSNRTARECGTVSGSGLTSSLKQSRNAHKRSVKFDSRPDDSLDSLMRNTLKENSSGNAPHHSHGNGSEKWWRVSDEQLDIFVRDLADQSASMDQENALCEQMCSAQPEVARSISSKSLSTSSCPGKEAITLKIHLVDSGDCLELRIDPDLKTGPCEPPPPNVFTDMFGQCNTSKGFPLPSKSFDYRTREFGATQRPGWTPAWTESLKEKIQRIIQVEPSRQQLFTRRCLMNANHQTLRSYGIKDGDLINLKIQKPARTPKKTKGSCACLHQAERDSAAAAAHASIC